MEPMATSNTKCLKGLFHMVISNNIQLILNILSLGIFASMVTGIFSMIIAILNNRRLTKIEIQREQFQMDQKKYISLVSLL